eukprot:jgi/Mesvir1/13420/Mv25102-RA.1
MLAKTMSGHGMAGLLHYGDVITLASPELGYVSSTGLADEGLRVEVYSQDVKTPSNLEDCKFEVCNKFVYTSAKLLLKELAREGKTLEDWEREARLRNQEGPKPPSKSLVELEAAVTSERDMNYDENARVAGRALTYGCVVQLRHVASGKFVTLHKARARLECDSIKAVLQPHGSDASWLVVTPGYRTKLLGDTVASSDTVTLASAKYSPFCLRVSLPSDEAWVKSAHEYVTGVKEVCGGAPEDMSRCRFRMALFSSAPTTLPPPAVTSLKPGDLLLLLHRATGCWLTSQEGRVVFQEPDPAADHVNSNALWTLEAEMVEHGGAAVVAAHQPYRLKHVASNQFLEALPMQGEDRLDISVMASQLSDGLMDDVSGLDSLLPSHNMPAATSPRARTQLSRTASKRGSQAHPGSDQDPQELTVQLTSRYTGRSTLWSFHHAHGEGEAGGFAYSASINIKSDGQGAWLGQARGEASSPADSPGVPRERPAVLFPSQDALDALGMRVVDTSIRPQLAVHRAAARLLVAFVERLRQTPALVEGKSTQDVLAQMRTRGMREVMVEHGPDAIRTLEHLALSLIDSDNFDPLRRMGTPVRQHQALLLELKVLDTVLDLLHLLLGAPAVGGKGIPPSLLENFTVFPEVDLLYLCRLCHAVLQGGAKGYPLAQRQLSRRVGIVCAGLAGDVGATETLCEVYRDNLALAQEIPVELVTQLVALLRHRPLPRFLRFLATICVVNGHPVQANQNKVVDAIFSADVLTTAKLERRERPGGKGEETTLVIYRDGDGGLQVDCRAMFDSMDDVAGKETSKLSEEEALFLFFLCQLQLFASVCQQRNRKAAEALLACADTLAVGYRELTAVAFHPQLPYPLRSAAVVLLQHLYVDGEPLEVIRPLNLTQIWPALDEIQLKKGKRPMDAFAAFPGKGPEPGFVTLKEQMMSYFKQLRGGFADSSHTSVNTLTLRMVQLAEALLVFGVLGSLDQQDLMVPDLVQVLVELLDGRDDPTTFGWSRFTYSPNNAPIVDAKLVICRILLLCYDMVEGRRVSAAFAAYCQTSTARPDGYEGEVDGGIESPRPQTPGGETPGTPIGEGVPLMKATGHGNHSARSIFTSNRVVASDGIISQELLNNLESKLFQVPLLGPRVPPVVDVRQELPDLVGVLLDLSRYEHPSLQAAAFRLLERHMTQRASLVRALQRVNVVVYPDVAATYQQARAHLAEFRRQLRWVSADNPKQRTDARAGLSLILTWLTSACSLGPANDKVAVGRRQKLLRDLDAIQLAVELLRVPLARQPAGRGQMDIPKDPELRNLFALCYEFLKRACGEVPHPDNQALVFAHRTLFLGHMGVERLGGVADTLAACIRDNPALAAQVTSADVRAIFDAIDRHGRHPQWIALLESLLVVRRKPVPRHQDMVLRLLLPYERVANFCRTPQEQAERSRWLKDAAQLSNPDSLLRYHAACVRLVAMCCAGKNPAACTKAARLISFDFAVTSVLSLHQMGASDPTTGGSDSIVPRLLKLVKGAFVDALCTLYAQSSSERAASDVRKPNNGIWPLLVDEAADPTLAASLSQKGSLLQVFLEDVHEAANAAAAAAASGTSNNASGSGGSSGGNVSPRGGASSTSTGLSPHHSHSGNPSPRGTSPSLTDVFKQEGGAVRYVLSSVLPMLTAYLHVHFTTPYVRLAEPHRQLLFHLATKVELLHNTLPMSLRGPSSALLNEMDVLGVLVKAEGSSRSLSLPTVSTSKPPSAGATRGAGTAPGSKVAVAAGSTRALELGSGSNDPPAIYDIIGTLGWSIADLVLGGGADAGASSGNEGQGFDSLQLMGRPSGNETFLRGWADFWPALARHLGVHDLKHFSDGGGRDLALLLSRDSTIPKSQPPFRFRVATRHLINLLAAEACAGASGRNSGSSSTSVHADEPPIDGTVDRGPAVLAERAVHESGAIQVGAAAGAATWALGRAMPIGRERFGPALTARFLRLLRGMLYLTDPANEALGEGGKHKEVEWAAGMADSVPALSAVFQELSRLSETDAASLAAWIQGKYKSLGLPSAAVRLAAHPDAAVQAEAWRLLVAMLEGCPEDVRAAIVAAAAQDGRLLARLRKLLRSAVTDARAVAKALRAARVAKESGEGGEREGAGGHGSSPRQAIPIGSGRTVGNTTAGSTGTLRSSAGDSQRGPSARRLGGVELVARGAGRGGTIVATSSLGAAGGGGVGGSDGGSTSGAAEEPSALRSGVLALALQLMESLCKEHNAGAQLMLAGDRVAAGASSDYLHCGTLALLPRPDSLMGELAQGAEDDEEAVGASGGGGTDLVLALVTLFEVLPPAIPESLAAGDGTLPDLAQQLLRALLAAIQGPCAPNQARVARSGFLLATRALMETLAYVLPLDLAAQNVVGGGAAAAASTGGTTSGLGSAAADVASPRVSLVRFQVVPAEWRGREHDSGSGVDGDHEAKRKGKDGAKGGAATSLVASYPGLGRSDVQCALRLCVLDVWLALIEEVGGDQEIPRRLAALADVPGLLAQLRLVLKLLACGSKGSRHSGSRGSGSDEQWAAERAAFGQEAGVAFESAVGRLYKSFQSPDAPAMLREEALKTMMLLQKLAPYQGEPEGMAARISGDATHATALVSTPSRVPQGKSDHPPMLRHPYTLPSSPSFALTTPFGPAAYPPLSALSCPSLTCMATGCGRACPPGDSAKVWEPAAGRGASGGRWLSFCLGHVLQRDPALQRFACRNVAAVEVVRERRVERVLFPITRECRSLLGDGLEEWQDEVCREIYSLPRDNVQLKALGFVDRAKYLCLRLQHFCDMEARRLGSRRTQDLHRRLLAAPYLLSLIILIIVIIRYGRDWDDWSADHNLTAWVMVQVLSWSTLAICILSLVLWMRLDAPLVIYELHNPCEAMQEGKRRRWLARKLAKVKKIIPSKKAGHGSMDQDSHEAGALRGLPRSDTIAFKPEPPLVAHPSSKSFKTLRNVVVPVEILVRAARRAPALDSSVWKRLTHDDISVAPPPQVSSGKKGRLLLRASSAVKELLITPQLLYAMAKVAVSALGCIWTPFFFSLLFVDYLVSYPSGRGLLQVAQVGVANLLKTATVAILLLTLYGLGTFVFFNGHHNACATLYECVGNHLVAGFAYSGKGVADVGGSEHGIGLGWGTAEWVGVPAEIQDTPRSQAHVAYVFIVAVIWTYLIANIATAQIVAAFALIREKTRRQQQDLENKCFICSLDRAEFEQHVPGGFNDHVQNIHNPFVYIFFVHYVLQKSLSKCTGMESYLKDQLAKETLDWLPIGITGELATPGTSAHWLREWGGALEGHGKYGKDNGDHAAKLEEALRLLAGMDARLRALEGKR